MTSNPIAFSVEGNSLIVDGATEEIKSGLDTILRDFVTATLDVEVRLGKEEVGKKAATVLMERRNANKRANIFYFSEI